LKLLISRRLKVAATAASLKLPLCIPEIASLRGRIDLNISAESGDSYSLLVAANCSLHRGKPDGRHVPRQGILDT
jgi:hypothetical protein